MSNQPPNDQDPLSPDALSMLPVVEPSVGFASRVIAAKSAEALAASASGSASVGSAIQVASGHRFVRYAAGAVLLGAMALGLHVFRGAEPTPTSGQWAESTRGTVSLGDRGVFVAEAGANVKWTLPGARAEVQQLAGNVFYRVEPGGPFVVNTPAGSVNVKGTCFRVEIDEMKPSKQSLRGAAVGAALAAAVVVTVYEGKVIFAEKGAAEPGGRSELVAGDSIRVPVAGGAGNGDSASAARLAKADSDLLPPDENVTREALLARDEKQRAEIRRLQTLIAARSGSRQSEDDDGRPWFDPSEENLQRMAKECRMRYDIPQELPGAPLDVGPKLAKVLGLTDEEGVKFANIASKVNESLREDVRALYIEATGDTKGADDLSVEAMGNELRDKSERGLGAKIQKRLSAERAGLMKPPADMSQTTPLERYYRQLAGVGDALEHELAAAFGAERARELRREAGGWGQRMEIAGCPGDEENERAEDVDL